MSSWTLALTAFASKNFLAREHGRAWDLVRAGGVWLTLAVVDYFLVSIESCIFKVWCSHDKFLLTVDEDARVGGLISAWELDR